MIVSAGGAEPCGCAGSCSSGADQAFVVDLCPLSCGRCSGGSTGAPLNSPAPITAAECKDLDAQCASWAAGGECTGASRAFMVSRCLVACGICGPIPSTASPLLNIVDPSVATAAPMAAAVTGAPVVPGGVCADQNVQCGAWKAAGVTAWRVMPGCGLSHDCERWWS